MGSGMAIAQKKDLPPVDWQHLDPQADGILGISTKKAYQELLQNKKASPVIVAVIDGGIEFNHEDLKNEMWVNTADSALTGNDRDGNGYVNDRYGWNFIGNAAGENVEFDNLEVTRLIRDLEPKYISVLPSTPLTADEKREFQHYQKLVTAYSSKLTIAQNGHYSIHIIQKAKENIVANIGKEKPTLADFKKYKAKDDMEKFALRYIESQFKENPDWDEFEESLKDAVKYFNSQILYHLNKDYDSRSIVGDNYENSHERHYGNSDVAGPDALHGTHVAAIIGASRDNGLGLDGISDAVQIMAIRAVPDGDERDKDVANSIRYAVDNGAKIINMSFGKGFAKDKAIVDEAVRYAMENDVLLVHAAGNDASNNDEVPVYPNKFYVDSLGINSGMADAWITVGANQWKGNSDLVASFSNYGKRTVDVFAPGAEIYSAAPESKYKRLDGTSMAAPVVSGLAALIRSYYPDLTAAETKQIIMDSVTPVDHKVRIRNAEGRRVKVRLGDISVSGGVVNAYKALQLAEERSK